VAQKTRRYQREKSAPNFSCIFSGHHLIPIRESIFLWASGFLGIGKVGNLGGTVRGFSEGLGGGKVLIGLSSEGSDFCVSPYSRDLLLP